MAAAATVASWLAVHAVAGRVDQAAPFGWRAADGIPMTTVMRMAGAGAVGVLTASAVLMGILAVARREERWRWLLPAMAFVGGVLVVVEGVPLPGFAGPAYSIVLVREEGVLADVTAGWLIEALPVLAWGISFALWAWFMREHVRRMRGLAAITAGWVGCQWFISGLMVMGQGRGVRPLGAGWSGVALDVRTMPLAVVALGMLALAALVRRRRAKTASSFETRRGRRASDNGGRRSMRARESGHTYLDDQGNPI